MRDYYENTNESDAIENDCKHLKAVNECVDGVMRSYGKQAHLKFNAKGAWRSGLDEGVFLH